MESDLGDGHGLLQEVPPARLRILDSQSQKGKSGFRDDVSGNGEGGLDREESEGLGQRIRDSLARSKSRLVLDLKNVQWDKVEDLRPLQEKLSAYRSRIQLILPKVADNVALEKFLLAARDADPAYFPDLSLSVIKLLGRGEYVVEFPGSSTPGHLGG